MDTIDAPRSPVAIRAKDGYGFLPAENPLTMVPRSFGMMCRRDALRTNTRQRCRCGVSTFSPGPQP